MDVALISPNPASNGGGVERFCNMLRDFLLERGHNAVVLGPADPPSGAQIVITNGMTGWPHDRAAVRIHVYHGNWPAHVLRGGLGGSSRRSTIRRFVQGSFAEFRAGVGAQRVSVSSGAQRDVRQWYGLSSTVLENGVDTNVFHPGDRLSARSDLGVAIDEPLALFVGRPESRKGGELALRAAEQLGLRLLHAGAPQLPGSTWLGALPPSELARALIASNVVLLPSFYEGCSFAVLEALASATPLVTTRTGWVPGLLREVPEFMRYVADPGDLRGLVRAARNALNDDPSVQEAAHSFVLRHNSLEAFGDRWIQYLESAASIDTSISNGPVSRQSCRGCRHSAADCAYHSP